MAIEVLTFTAPTYWASAIINGDGSGLVASGEQEDVNAWLESLLPAYIVSTNDGDDGEGAGFLRWHDAEPFMPLAADCSYYIAHLQTADKAGSQYDHETEKKA